MFGLTKREQRWKAEQQAAEVLAALAGIALRAAADVRVAESKTGAEELARLRTENGELRRLLARYRDETPLGHQPHMIAHQVDETLSRVPNAKLKGASDDASTEMGPDVENVMDRPATYGEQYARSHLPAAVQFDDPYWWRDIGQEIDRLRDTLLMLEAACDRRAECLTPEVYLAGMSIPGMREAAYELDVARRNARELLTPNASLSGRGTDVTTE